MPYPGDLARGCDLPTPMQAYATAALTLTNANQDCPGASLTFRTAGTTTSALVVGVFDFDATVLSAGNTCVGEASIDGVATSAHEALFVPTAAGGRATVPQYWYVTLAAGLHTIKLQARTVTGAGTYHAYQYHTGLTVVLLNSGV